MKNCLGIINLDEDESRMGELIRYRTLASVPMAARYRIIDFVLSNMTNSGIEGIGIFTKNKSRSLIDHLTNGRPWDLHRKKDGLRIFNFGEEDPVHDDVHNFSDNIEFIKFSRREYVLIAPSYMICNIDYNEVMKKHIKEDNDVTVVYKNVSNADKKFIDCEVLNIDDTNRIISVGQNIGREENANINMEMYIMRTDLFIDIVHESIKHGMYRKIKQFINRNLKELKVGTFKFNGYVACINSVDSYFNSNMDLLNEKINKELFYADKPIYTKSRDESGTQYTETSDVSNCIIANGSYIAGTVKNCIVSRRVNVGEGAVLENCVIMQNTIIGAGASMAKVIVDKGTVIRENEVIRGTKSYPVTIQKRRMP